MSIYILGVLSESMYEKERVDMFAKANIIADTTKNHIGIQDGQIGESIIRTLAGTKIRGIITDSAYTVLFDTNTEAELLGKIFMRDIIKTSLGGEQAYSVYKNPSENSNMIAVAVPIKQNESITGSVYLTESVANTDKTINYIKMNLFIFSGLISILVGMLSLGMSYIVTSPVDEFILVAKEISKGNFSKRLKVKGHNELSEMAQTMNYMCEELEQIENNRKKFVSDASHELKTPLATIKLICDSIVSTENPDPSMVKEFLNDLNDEVDRLTRIVDRLLTLTKLDSKQDQTKFETVDLVELLNGVIRKLTPAANKKNISIYTEFNPEFAKPMLLDRDKILEAVYNIADNAIKYTPDNGFVRIGLYVSHETIVIKIEDNGPGIPESEKDRIFERFYRLDDSRARETGGTGLGLAIAKEAVAMHGGRIDVLSEEGVGSTFLIILPYIGK
ncbi:MAG: cell wall metabolism sensor histidine kinase WalK [Clostridia bacterium]|nr:cell wall metabolism sensor histidine kinase WalK [Clostridia bacterium]